MSLLDKASLVITPNSYKESKLYSVVPNTTLGDMDVVRATTATRVNSAGLIEEVPRNLITYSEQIDNAVWLKTNLTVTANATTSPNGTTTADKLIPTTTNDLHIVEGSLVSFVSGNSYTFSFYAKRAENNFIQITASSSLLSTRANFNLLNGTLGFVDSGITATITPINNDWYRCTASFVASTTGNFRMVLCNIPASTSARFATFSGNGTSGLFVWGIQVDNGSTATEYFPTTTRLNIPRIDYTNGSCPSLLVEPQRTNLILQSNTFTNVAWGKLNATVTANAIVSPDGTTNASKLVAINPIGNNWINQISTNIAGTTTFTIYAKQGEYNGVFLYNNTINTGRIFNLNTGTLGSVIGLAPIDSRIESVGNGWYRVTLITNSTALNEFRIYIANNDAFGNLGNGTSGIFVYGAQLEVGAYATSLIPTVASSVTRNADLISKTGISSLIGTEFTLFFDGFESIGGNSSRYIVLKGSGGFYANLIIIEQTPTNLIAAFINDGSSSNIFASYSAQLTSGQRVKFALRCKNNDFAFYVNGQLRNIQTSGTVPTTSSLYLGFYNDYADNYNKINSAVIFNSALSNAEMLQLTTL